MKIGGFQKTSLVDYPGKVASIVFTSGCNMRCGYCYNADLACGRVPTITPKTIFQQLLDRRKYVDAVVITGGEPTIWPDLPGFMEQLKTAGFSVKLDTNGMHPERLDPILKADLADYIAMDIKAPWGKYSQITGVTCDVEKLCQSVARIRSSGIDYEFRTTVAPGLVESDLKEISSQITGAKRWFLQPFQPKENIMSPGILRQTWLSVRQIEAVCQEVKPNFGRCSVRS